MPDLYLPLSKRDFLYESFYLDYLNRSVQFLIANSIDLEKIGEFLKENICNFDEICDVGKIDLNNFVDLNGSVKEKHLIIVADCYKICGIGLCVKRKFNGSDVIWIQCLFVEKEYGGLGSKTPLNEMLLKQLMILAEKQKASNVYWSCLNQIDIDLAKKIGFQSVTFNGSNNLMEIALNKVGGFLHTSIFSLPEAYKLSKADRYCWDRFTVKETGREIKIVEALVEDEEIIRRYAKNEVIPQMPTSKTFQFNRQEIDELVENRLCHEQLANGYVLMILDEDKICGMAMNRIVKVNRMEKISSQMPEDFLELSKKQPFKSERLCAYSSAINWMHQCVVEHLSKNCRQYLRIEMVSVHPQYESKGIGRRLGIATLTALLEKGHTVMESLAIAKASAQGPMGIGAIPSRVFHYSDFKYNKQMLFPNNGELHDGAQAAYLFVRDIFGEEASDVKEDTIQAMAKL